MQRRDTSRHGNRNHESVVVGCCALQMNPGVPGVEELEVADAAREILVD